MAIELFRNEQANMEQIKNLVSGEILDMSDYLESLSGLLDIKI